MNLSKSLHIDSLRSALIHFGHKHDHRPFADFIAFKETIRAAEAAGLSVGEFLEHRHAVGPKTALDETIDTMASLGVFDERVQRACEIGPGSGRYLQRTIARCNPVAYEIYETSEEWRNWLIHDYNVIARTSDWRTLSETASCSVDLVHAHKVFPGLPLLVTLSYFEEMTRVVRDGGWIVFDALTEKCFSPENLRAWFDVNPWNWDWSPQMCARELLLAIFAAREVSLVGSFTVTLYPGVTECFVLRKMLPAAPSASDSPVQA